MPLVSAVQKRICGEHRFSTKLAVDHDRLMSRRTSVASRFQQRILRRVLTSAGVDYGAVEKQQAKDKETNRRLLAQRRGARIKRSNEVVRRQNATLVWLIRHLDRPPDPLGPMTVHLPTATDILPTLFANVGTLPQTSVAPGQNLAIGLLDANSDRPYLYEGLFIPFHFVWDSDRDGAANVASTVWPNVSTSLLLQPACTGDPSAAVELRAQMYVSQLDAEDQLHSIGSDEVVYLEEKLRGSRSLGEFGGGDYSNVISLSYDNFPIVAGRPVLITILVSLAVQASGGAEAQIDFQSGGLRINVPFVNLLVS